MSPPESNPPNAAAPSSIDVLSLESWSASSGSDRPSRARLIVSGGGRRWRAHAAGNGAVDALFAAADEALAPLLGRGVRLLSYEVRASGPGHETVGGVTLSIAALDSPQHAPHQGQAIHANVLQASIAAYIAAINDYLAVGKVDLAALIPAPVHTKREAAEPEHEVRASLKRDLNELYNR